MISIRQALQNSVLLTLFLVSSSSYSYPNDYYKKSSFDDAGAIALVVGGIAAGAYGLYKLIDWCCTPSNEALLNSGNDLFQQANYRFQSIMTHTHAIQAVYPCEYYYDPQWIHHNETVLFNITSHCFREESIHHYIDTLNNFTYQTRNKTAEINSRILKLKADKQYSKYVGICDQLQQTADKLSAINTNLETIYNYLKSHRKYIDLWQAVRKVSHCYARENEFVQFPFSAGITPTLMALAMTHADVSCAKYPILKYVEKVSQARTDLSGALVDTGLCSHLHQEATLFLKKIETIKGCIVSSDRYIQERAMAEKERREQALIALQQQQLLVQQQQLLEAQKQNELKLQELKQQQAQQWYENVYGKPVQQHNVVVNIRQ